MEKFDFDTRLMDAERRAKAAEALAETRLLALKQLAQDTMRVVEIAKQSQAQAYTFERLHFEQGEFIDYLLSLPFFKRVWYAVFKLTRKVP